MKLLRGRLLTFTREPEGANDTDAHTYIEDGALLLDGGTIKAMGIYADLAKPGLEVITIARI